MVASVRLRFDSGWVRLGLYYGLGLGRGFIMPLLWLGWVRV